MDQSALDPRNDADIGLTQFFRALSDDLEYRLQVRGRPAYYVEHVAWRGLLLQRLPQLVQQPGILNRDHSLFGKIGEQLDLLLRERSSFLTENGEDADQLVFAEHGHAEHASVSGQSDGRDDKRVPQNVSFRPHHVRSLHGPLRLCCPR